MCGARNHELDRVQISTREGLFSEGKVASPGHAGTCPEVDVLEATQQGSTGTVADAGWSVLVGVHIDVIGRIRLNSPYAAAMRPCIKLL